MTNVRDQTQPTFTCSKSTVETPEQCVKSVQSYQQRHQNDVSNFIVYFEQIWHIDLFPLLTLSK